MVIDTSALLAILFDEPERRSFNEAIEAAESRLISAATFLEASMVIESRFGAEGVRDLDLFIERGIEIAAVDSEQAHAARRAFSRFGKGRHRAGLNYGDCCQRSPKFPPSRSPKIPPSSGCLILSYSLVAGPVGPDIASGKLSAARYVTTCIHEVSPTRACP